MPELVRTDEQVMSKSPVKVKFGDVDYEIKPLPIIPQREWRDNLFKQIQSIGEEMNTPSNNPQFLSSLAFLFLQFPEKIVELVFAYAPYLPKDKIMDAESGATEEQMARAFSFICQLAFPFVAELRMMTQTMGMAVNFPQLAKFTKQP